jgi:hypothetical protein
MPIMWMQNWGLTDVTCEQWSRQDQLSYQDQLEHKTYTMDVQNTSGVYKSRAPVHQRLIFVGPNYGTCIMSSI